MKISSTSLRLAFYFGLAMTSLLLILNFVVARQGRHTFENTFQTFQIQSGVPGQWPKENTIDTAPHAFIKRLPDGAVGAGGGVMSVGTAGSPVSPQSFFTKQFRTALLWITLAGIVLSLLLGIFMTQQLIAKPMQRFRRAIRQLKMRNFGDEIQLTGVAEFDAVVGEFNELTHELSRAEELRKDLISDTSHELKTPLSALQIQLEGMRDGLIPYEPKRVNMLIKQVERLTDITERLQEYTRLRHHAARLHKTKWKLLPFVQMIADEHTEALQAAGMEVTLEIPKDLTVIADKKLFEQVLTNLFANALRYSGGNALTISATDHELRFQDNGKGVPAKDLPLLFERFFRVERSRNRNQGGLGLGLAIVSEIIEAHGWTISARNAKPGLEIVILTS